MYCITSHIWDRPTRDCCTLSQRQNGYSVVPEHPHVGPHGPNRASFFMNPMYSIARTRQCPRKSCSPRQPMAAYMWNGLQPVTSFTLIPNPNLAPLALPPEDAVMQRIHIYIYTYMNTYIHMYVMQQAPPRMRCRSTARSETSTTLEVSTSQVWGPAPTYPKRSVGVAHTR